MELPEYLRDMLEEQKNREELLVPRVPSSLTSWGKPIIEDCLFSDEEIAEQEASLHTLNGDPYSMHYWAEEYHREESLGINSWLDNQPKGPGVSNPTQDRNIELINKFGYARVFREIRPSILLKDTLKSLRSISRPDQLVDSLKTILKEFKLDPKLFFEIEQTYKYKS